MSGVYEAVEELLEASPMPWTRTMIRDWFGWDKYKASRYLVEMAAKGRIARVARGVFTAKNRVPLTLPSHDAYRTATFSARVPGDVVTDDMLAKYGFNL